MLTTKVYDARGALMLGVRTNEEERLFGEWSITQLCPIHFGHYFLLLLTYHLFNPYLSNQFTSYQIYFVFIQNF